MNILITRPQPQADLFADKLINLGYHNIFICPLFTITPLLTTAHIPEILTLWPQNSLAIFTSNNAVHSLFPLLQKTNFNYQQLPMAAIGPSTASALMAYGCNALLAPKTKPFNSEALLAIINNAIYYKFIIFTGETRRNLIMQTLHAQNKLVSEIVCYRITTRNDSEKQFLDILQQAIRLDIIFITCETSLKILTLLLKKHNLFHLLNTAKLIVASYRIKASATHLGWQKIYLANGASDADMLAVLADLVYDILL